MSDESLYCRYNVRELTLVPLRRHPQISGRARRGPAPLNLEVPSYEFAEETKLVIG